MCHEWSRISAKGLGNGQESDQESDWHDASTRTDAPRCVAACRRTVRRGGCPPRCYSRSLLSPARDPRSRFTTRTCRRSCRPVLVHRFGNQSVPSTTDPSLVKPRPVRTEHAAIRTNGPPGKHLANPVPVGESRPRGSCSEAFPENLVPFFAKVPVSPDCADVVLPTADATSAHLLGRPRGSVETGLRGSIDIVRTPLTVSTLTA